MSEILNRNCFGDLKLVFGICLGFVMCDLEFQDLFGHA